MATLYIAPHLSPTKECTWRCVSIILLAYAAAACSLVDYSLGPSNLTSNRNTGSTRELGTIYFHYSDDTEPYAVHVNRTKRGYALNAPIYNDEDTGAHFTVSRTKDYQFFVGIQGQYTF